MPKWNPDFNLFKTNEYRCDVITFIKKKKNEAYLNLITCLKILNAFSSFKDVSANVTVSEDDLKDLNSTTTVIMQMTNKDSCPNQVTESEMDGYMVSTVIIMYYNDLGMKFWDFGTRLKKTFA